MSPNLYASTSADRFDATHGRRVFDLNLSHPFTVIYNVEIGNCLLKLIKMAGIFEGQSLAVLVGARCLPADAKGEIKSVWEGVGRHEMHL